MFRIQSKNNIFEKGEIGKRIAYLGHDAIKFPQVTNDLYIRSQMYE